LASSMLCVVSGQTVVHSESSNDSMTTLPRNWLSDIGWPNWFVSRKSGAGSDPSEEPRSRLGLFIPAAIAVAVCELTADPEPEAVLQPTAPARTPSMATAGSRTRARNAGSTTPARNLGMTACTRNLVVTTPARNLVIG